MATAAKAPDRPDTDEQLPGMPDDDAPDAEPDKAPDRAKKAPASKKASSSKKATSRPGRRPSAGKKGGRPRNRNLADELATLLATTGTLVTAGAAVNPRLLYDGQAIVTQAPAIAQALADVAKVNPAVEKVLWGMLDTSAWGAVAVAVGPLIIAVAANHGALPSELPQLVGMPPVPDYPEPPPADGPLHGPPSP